MDPHMTYPNNHEFHDSYDIDGALNRFLVREPEIPFDLHNDLATIIVAARAHATTLRENETQAENQ